jgi:hypothetical protein
VFAETFSVVAATPAYSSLSDCASIFCVVLQMAAYRDSLLYFMIFLRITPLVPNSFVNMASPVVGIPFHIFFFGTLLVSLTLAKRLHA